MTHFAFGSNSRVRAAKARKMLDWKPTGASLLDEIASSYYRFGICQTTYLNFPYRIRARSP